MGGVEIYNVQYLLAIIYVLLSCSSMRGKCRGDDPFVRPRGAGLSIPLRVVRQIGTGWRKISLHLLYVLVLVHGTVEGIGSLTGEEY